MIAIKIPIGFIPLMVWPFSKSPRCSFVWLEVCFNQGFSPWAQLVLATLKIVIYYLKFWDDPIFLPVGFVYARRVTTTYQFEAVIQSKFLLFKKSSPNS
jgi:hypothetical protein